MAEIVVDVQVACDDETPPESEIEVWVIRALEGAGGALPATAEVAVRVVGPEEMQTLNRDFRFTNASTNVLAFPAGEQPRADA
ncbi:MAG: rRNA maturation RNAse YbeY, partial [Woeseiaceae bacterium]